MQTWMCVLCSHLKHHSWFLQQIRSHVGADDAVVIVETDLNVFPKATAVVISGGLCISNGLCHREKCKNMLWGWPLTLNRAVAAAVHFYLNAIWLQNKSPNLTLIDLGDKTADWMANITVGNVTTVLGRKSTHGCEHLSMRKQKSTYNHLENVPRAKKGWAIWGHWLILFLS